MQACVERFRSELAATGADYLCESDLAGASLGGPQLRVRFIGRFEQAEVVWDAHLLALGQAADSAQFIEIATPTARGRPIRIGLAVARIDRPTLLKTIIMVRNYKRLRLGRHEFGPQGPVASVRHQQ